MQLENQVCSLELAKQLKELGVPQDSLFYWRIGGAFKNPQTTVLVPESDMHMLRTADGAYNYISAFTVAELGEMLPSWVYTTKDDGTNKSFTSWYGDENTPNEIDIDGDNNIQHAETEADARAKMLIWLIENKYLSLPTEE